MEEKKIISIVFLLGLRGLLFPASKNIRVVNILNTLDTTQQYQVK